jgi:osmoprotectant transport system ATP-binding protein
MIELENVVRSYGGRRVVDEVSFAVPSGAFCALVGSSGAGKSTTLKLINRLLPLSSGAIRVGGADIAAMAPETLRRRIGYVIQSIGLFPHWTVAQNIATVPRLLGWSEAKTASRVEELVALMGLDPAHATRFPRELSGGQQQRVGVARALAADPELLLMDEPFGALDPLTRAALAKELAQIHRRTRKTILFVTHDIDMALDLADIIAIMHEGRLVQFGRPLDILERPASDFVRAFTGGAALGLKLLGVRRVAERIRVEPDAPGDPLDPSASLAEALSEMVVRHTDRLPVKGENGRPGGSVALSDLVR